MAKNETGKINENNLSFFDGLDYFWDKELDLW